MSVPEKSAPLHPLEVRLLQALSKSGSNWVDFDAASSSSGLSPDQLRRAIEWLKSKGLLEERSRDKTAYSLGEKGKTIAAEGLPERELVRLIQDPSREKTMSSLAKELGGEFSVALGRARKNGWIKIGRNQEIELEPAARDDKEPEEEILEKLQATGPLSAEVLTPAEKDTLVALSKRQKGIILEEFQKQLSIRPTQEGLEASGELAEDEIGEITPDVLRNKEWREKRLRPINMSSPAPNFYGGRKHPMRLFIQEVREAFLSLGFSEIQGPIVQSAFWNFDALFIPQHHSAREMQDTFYVGSVEAKLSDKDRAVAAVKASHEDGKGTGSIAWGPGWEADEARRVVLRTHTTAITIRYLSDNRPEEARVFSVDKVFRNEKPSYKNNPEFYQIEGVMTAPGLNIRNLIYVITEFYAKLGFTRIKFWPTYFPYTEPSLQTVVYDEQRQKWLELGGMGVFRPEVTIPLGIKNPVLAWGLGLDRLVMMRHNLQDIRDLFGPNLGWLRNSGVL